jgi:hypothetical protein
MPLLDLALGLPHDWELLILAFPSVGCQMKQLVVVHLAMFMGEV